jgi:O-acetyl-ADP-ribose deacetylase
VAEERFVTTLATGHTLALYRGDLTEEAVDAIVNAANSGLAHGGGVAGAIVRKGGEIIQRESDRVGRVRTGSAAITGAGSLPAKFVIHAVGPMYTGFAPEEAERLLASAALAALEIARVKGLTSVAFPAISSGIFKFPKPDCARVLIGAAVAWAEAHPDDGPREIRFTIIDEETAVVFRQEFARRFA